MKFCSECAHPVEYKIPEDDNRQRAVCTQCGTIHYQNPRIIAGTIPNIKDKVLLCKRAIEPRKGYWTLPAGFMELDETLEQGALRETYEEAGIKPNCGPLVASISVPFISQVHIFFAAEMANEEHALSTSESTEVALFDYEDIPWNELAFPTVKKALEYFLQVRHGPDYAPLISDIQPLERLQRPVQHS